MTAPTDPAGVARGLVSMGEIERAVSRLPFLHFVQRFVDLGGCPPGTYGLSDPHLENLHIVGLLALREKPRSRNRVTVVRRFRIITRSHRSRAFVDALHHQLRQRNMASVMGFDDGEGQAAFRDECRDRPADVRQAAILAARSVFEDRLPPTPDAPPTSTPEIL